MKCRDAQKLACMKIDFYTLMESNGRSKRHTLKTSDGNDKLKRIMFQGQQRYAEVRKQILEQIIFITWDHCKDSETFCINDPAIFTFNISCLDHRTAWSITERKVSTWPPSTHLKHFLLGSNFVFNLPASAVRKGSTSHLRQSLRYNTNHETISRYVRLFV